MRARARICANQRRHYAFWAVKPVSYPVPTDGPVGKMLLRTGRHPYRPAHTHMIVSAAGCATVTTHLFVKGDPHIDSDAVFGEKDSLVVDFVRHEPGVAIDGATVDSRWNSVNYDFRLARSGHAKLN